MSIYNPEQDGVREAHRKPGYLKKAAALLEDLDVYTLVDIIVQGEDEWLRVGKIIYGANGFQFFTNEDYRALYRMMNQIVDQKVALNTLHSDQMDRLYRSRLNPEQQQLAYEKRQRQKERERWQ